MRMSTILAAVLSAVALDWPVSAKVVFAGTAIAPAAAGMEAKVQFAAIPASPLATALSGTVSGQVQRVGFRALIFKEAIRYNLAGEVRNQTDGTVRFVLQGPAGRISKALRRIRKGTRASNGVAVTTESASPREGLGTFTVWGWTSATRQVTKPYDLVFALRTPDGTVSAKEAAYRRILEETLDPTDRPKLRGR